MNELKGEPNAREWVATRQRGSTTPHHTFILFALVVLLRMLFAGSSTPIICCTSANEVKSAIAIYCRENHTVLELGAELGDVSAHICRTIGPNGKAVLVDKKRKEVTTGRCKLRHREAFVKQVDIESVTQTKEESDDESSNKPKEDVECFIDRATVIELDELSEWKDKIFGPDTSSSSSSSSIGTGITPSRPTQYNVIVMSIGAIIGHDLYMTMLSLADEILNCLPKDEHAPLAMIVKSKKLYSLSRRLIHPHHLFDGTVQFPANVQRSAEPYIIAGVKVGEYRKTIPFTVRKEDAILEVGCHFGRTTKILHDAGKYCIGVDIGPKIIKNAKKQYPEIPFAVGDAWKTMQLLKFKKTLLMQDNDETMGYDLVYADIGGLSGADGHLESLSLLDSLGYALEPRCIVIKSTCMRGLASKLKFFPDIYTKHQAVIEREDPSAKRAKIDRTVVADEN
eukprot:scaffold132634_cov53-Attheya_sp.AAC.2